MRQYQAIQHSVIGDPERGSDRKSPWRNNDQKCSKFDENYKPTYPRSQRTPKKRNIKGNTTKHIKIKLLQTGDKEDLKAAGEKGIINSKDKDQDDNRIASNYESQKTMRRLKVLEGKVKTVNLEFYSQWK